MKTLHMPGLQLFGWAVALILTLAGRLAAQADPTFVLGSAVVSNTAVILSGTVYSNGATGISIWWQYGMAAGNYPGIAGLQALPAHASVAVSTAIPYGGKKGLHALGTYHYQFAVFTKKTFGVSGDQTFILQVPALSASLLATSTSDAAIQVIANPKGLATSVSVQYGTTLACTGGTTAWVDIGSAVASSTLTLRPSNLSPGTVYAYRVSGSSSFGIFYSPVQLLATAAPFNVVPDLTPGDPAPGALAGGTFAGFGNPAMNGLGHLAFQGYLSGVGVNSTNNGGIWILSGSGAYNPVAVLGGTAPGGAGGSSPGTFGWFGDPVFADDDGIAFLGLLNLSGAVAKTNWLGVWSTSRLSGSLALVARMGDPAPDFFGATSGSSPQFAWFYNLALPGQGGVIFTATLAIGTNGVTSANNAGIWAVDRSGTLREIIRTGQGFTLNGVAKVVKTFAIFNQSTFVGGQSRHFNAAGDVLVQVLFSDGSYTLLKAALQ